MSLNCLTCGQVLQRVNSDREYSPEVSIKACRKVARQHVDRSWSGNISPPQSSVAKMKAEHRRTNSTGDVGPRLLRSSGVRRDWSFEELAAQQDKRVRSRF